MKVGKKILAVLCAVVLCLGSMNLPGLSYVEAAASSVRSIVLKNAEGIAYADDLGNSISDMGEGEILYSNSSCYAKFNSEDNSVTLTPEENSQDTFQSNRVYFFIKAEIKPTISTVDGIYRAVIGASGTDIEDEENMTLWRVALTLLSGATGDVEVTTTPGIRKYMVTYPQDSDDYTIQNNLAGKEQEVAADQGAEFSVEVNNDEQYELIARANGVRIADVEKNGNVYTFKTGKLTMDTEIRIEITEKSYGVTLPASNEYYSVSPSNSPVQVKYGQIFTFRITPKTGANPPTVIVNGDEVEEVTTNTYEITVNGNMVIEANANGWKNVNVVLVPGSNFSYASATGEGAAPTTAEYNSMYQFKVVPNAGYEISSVYTTNGLEVKKVENEENTYQIDRLTADSTTIMAVAEVKKYTITPPTEQGGFHFNMEGSTSVSYGSSVTFYVDPADGYETPAVRIREKGDNGKGTVLTPGANNRYSYPNVTADMEILVEAGAKKTFNVSFLEGEGYTYSEITTASMDAVRDSSTKVVYGGRVSFKVTPAEGYEISLVTCNTNRVLTPVGEVYTIDNVTEDLIIRATAAKSRYEVTFTEPDEDKYYELTPGTSPVEYRGSYSFYAIAKEGYNAPIIKVGEQTYSPLANGQYIIPNITGPTDIIIENGNPLEYTVVFNQGAGYQYLDESEEVEFKDSKTVLYDENLKFKLRLDSSSNQSTPEVTISGIKVNPDENGVYTISNIKADKVVSVTGVTKNTYNVNLVQGNSYDLTTTESTKVTAGSTFSFRLTAKTGYDISDAVVTVAQGQEETSTAEADDDGVYTIVVNNDTRVTVSNVKAITSGITIAAENAIVTDAEGTIIENPTVEYNGSFKFKVRANKGYRITQVSVNGSEIVAVNGEYTINNIIENKNIVVSTEKLPSVTVTASNATVIDVDDTNREEIAYNGSYKFRIEPNAGYQVTQVAVDGVVVEPVGNVYTINNITQNKAVQIFTELKVLTVHYASSKYSSEVEETVEYTINDMPKGSLAVKEVAGDISQVYGFDGWYDGEKRVDEFTEDQLGKEITLTANWVPIIQKLMDIVTEGVENKDIEDQYVITYTTLIKFKEALSEEYETSVRITGYGTLYSPEEIDTTNPDIQEAVLGRSPEIKDGIITQTGVAGKRLTNYYRNRDFEPSKIGTEGVSFGLLKYSANPVDRWGAGWIELTVDGKKVVVYSTSVSVTYNPNAENAEAVAELAQEAGAAETQNQEETSSISETESEETDLSGAAIQEVPEEETVAPETEEQAAPQETEMPETEAVDETTAVDETAAPEENVNAENISEETPAAEDMTENTEVTEQ